jgi:hypothetical protein
MTTPCSLIKDPQIRVFSHTHMVGPGVLDYGKRIIIQK